MAFKQALRIVVLMQLLYINIASTSQLEHSTEMESEIKTENTLERMIGPHQTDEILPPPKDYLTRDVDKVMIPLYDSTHYFIETALAPPSLQRLNSTTFDLAKWRHVGDVFHEDWVGWMDHYLVYVMCMTAAGIYIIFLISCSTSTCCCRLRGNCGSYDAMDGKHATCKRRTCGVFLLVVNLLVLLGVIAAFIANQLIWEQTVTSGMTNTFHRSLINTQQYQNNTQLAYVDIDEDTDRAYDDMQSQVENLSVRTAAQIEERYNVSQILDELEKQSRQLVDIIEPIQNVANLTDEISGLEMAFQTELQQIQDDLKFDLDFCQLPECISVMNTSDSITILTNFSSLPDISHTADVFLNLTSGNSSIFVHITMSRDSYATLPNHIQQQISNETDRLQNSTTEMHDSLKFLLNYTIEEVINKFDVEAAIRDLEEDTQPSIANDGDIRYFCCLAMCILALVIVVLGFLALCFGVCGERAGEDVSYCNRGRGANILKLSMVFIVILGIIFMCGITLFFILGTITHNDVCRPLTDPNVQDDAKLTVDYALTNKFNLQTSFARMLRSSSMNESLYVTMDIETLGLQYNITEILRLERYDIEDTLDRISSTNFTIEIVIVGDLEQDLKTIDRTFTEMELDKYQEELLKNVTNINILEFSQYLEELSFSNNDTNSTLSDIFSQYATEYEQLYDTYSRNIEALSQQLTTELEPISQVEESFNATQYLVDLSQVEAALNTTEDVEEIMQGLTDDLNEQYQDFSSANIQRVTEEIGPSIVLFESYQESSVAFCVLFLYPFNAFWLSIGWCLMWYLPLLLIDLCLVDVYNKSEEYNEIFRGVGRTSFHRQRPPGSSKGRRGKSKNVISGIQLDHDPGCTDDDEDIDPEQYGRETTTSFHGNDAFGYQGRRIDDDALEYFGNSHPRILASRHRGMADGVLPPESYGGHTSRSNTSRSTADTANTINTNSNTTNTNTTNPQAASRAPTTTHPPSALPSYQQATTRSTHSAKTSKSSDSSSDEDSVTKGLEHVSRSSTYPIRQAPPEQPNASAAHGASRLPSSQDPAHISQTYSNPPPAAEISGNKRKGIPTPFMRGAQNYAFDQQDSADSNEEYVDEDYAQRMRRTSQRLSRERETKKARKEKQRADQERREQERRELDRRDEERRRQEELVRNQNQNQVKPWYVQLDGQNEGNSNENLNKNQRNQSERQSYRSDPNTRPKERNMGADQSQQDQSNAKPKYTVYPPIQAQRDSSQPQSNRNSGPFTESPTYGPNEVYPNQYDNYLNQNEQGASNGDYLDEPSEEHNVKPSELKNKSTHPLQFWQPPPPPPAEEENDAFYYPPVSMLAPSPARNFSRPAATIQPYSHSPQRASPVEALPPTPQGYAYNPKSKSSGPSREEYPVQSYYDNQGYSSQGEAQTAQTQDPVQPPFSYLTQSPLAYRESNRMRTDQHPQQQAQYGRQASSENPGHLNAAYF